MINLLRGTNLQFDIAIESFHSLHRQAKRQVASLCVWHPIIIWATDSLTLSCGFFRLLCVSISCPSRFLPKTQKAQTHNTCTLCRLCSDTEKHSGDFILFMRCSSPRILEWVPYSTVNSGRVAVDAASCFGLHYGQVVVILAHTYHSHSALTY